MIEHLVLTRYLAETTEAMRADILNELRELCDRLEGFEAFELVENISPETPVVHGFTQGFICRFSDIAARDRYLVNETHKQIGSRLVKACGGVDGILVVDRLLADKKTGR